MGALRLTSVFTVAVAAFAIAVGSAAAAPVKIAVRIEGPTSTILEGKVATEGQLVTTESGGTHECDGTNGGANPTPGPTATSALASAATKHAFSFDGPYFHEFEDFVISRIGATADTSTEFWALAINEEPAPVGGCQQEVEPGQEVLWAFVPSGVEHILRLTKGQHHK